MQKQVNKDDNGASETLSLEYGTDNFKSTVFKCGANFGCSGITPTFRV